jgi:hypothetical protein
MSSAAAGVEQGEILILRRAKGYDSHEKAVALIGALGATADDAFTAKITERGGGHGIQLEITGARHIVDKALQIATASGWRVPTGSVSVSEIVMVQPIPRRNAFGFNAVLLQTTRGNWGNMTRRSKHSSTVNRNGGTRRRMGLVTQVQSAMGYTDAQFRNVLREQSDRNLRAAQAKAAKAVAEVSADKK